MVRLRGYRPGDVVSTAASAAVHPPRFGAVRTNRLCTAYWTRSSHRSDNNSYRRVHRISDPTASGTDSKPDSPDASNGSRRTRYNRRTIVHSHRIGLHVAQPVRARARRRRRRAWPVRTTARSRGESWGVRDGLHVGQRVGRQARQDGTARSTLPVPIVNLVGAHAPGGPRRPFADPPGARPATERAAAAQPPAVGPQAGTRVTGDGRERRRRAARGARRRTETVAEPAGRRADDV